MRALRWLRQLFCRHECMVSDIKRLSPEEVVCSCRKCCKVLHAPFALDLPARLMR